MPRRPTRILLATLLALAIALPAVAQTEYEGTTAGGAFYKFAVPDNWNGTLVIYNHGFDFSEPEAVDDLGPLIDIQLSQGFAVAASSYRQRAWALFKTHQDLKAMYAAFRSRVGTPSQTLIYGFSLGGLVTAQAVEKGGLGNVTGAFAACGPMGGSRNWDGGLDLRLLYDFVCSEVPGAAIAGGPKGLEKRSTLTREDVERAVNACTGVDELPFRRSRRQRANLKTLGDVSGLPESFLQTQMRYVTEALADLTYDRGKLKGKQGIGNKDVDYGDAEVNAGIERVKARKGPARKLKRSYTPTGRVGKTKIVSMHTDKDGLVIVENASEYQKKVPAENLTVAIVEESIPTHCFFSPPEVVAGWQSLLDWVETDSQPSARDLQDSCELFASLLPGPCRINPEFEIPDMDGRVRPR